VRLLVRGVNWLGDAIMTTPALLRVRELLPEAEITLCGPDKLAGLWVNHPAVDAVLPIVSGAGMWSVAGSVRAGGFTHALILPNSPRSALESWLGGVPCRIGYARLWRNLFLTHKVADRRGMVRMQKKSPAQIRQCCEDPALANSAGAIPQEAHHIHHYLHLVGAMGANLAPLAPQLVVTEQERAAFCRRFQLDPERLWCGLNPGAEYGPAKRWPMERFAQAAIEIQKRTPCGWLIFGGKADVETGRALAEKIRAAAGADAAKSVVCLAGETHLRELCAGLAVCRVLLTNDTGPMHLAAAVGTPVVAIFGSTCPELTGPGLPGSERHVILRGNAPCAPCYLRQCPIDFRCMTGIPVEAAVRAVLATLSGTRNGG
jgi:heptosyltransferase-2